MLPFTELWFPNPEVERRFEEHRTRSYFAWVDGVFFYLNTLIHVLHPLQQLSVDGLSWTTASSFALSCFVFAHYWLSHRYNAKHDVMIRTRLSMALRVVLCPISPAIFFPGWFRDAIVDTSSFARVVAMNSGLLSLIVTCFGVPLLMKYHLPIQMVSAYLIAISVPKRSCRFALKGQEAADYITKISRLMDFLFLRNLKKCRDTVLVDVEREVCALGTPLESCERLLKFFYVIAGFCAPSYLLWLQEYQCRLHYLQEHEWEMNGRQRGIQAPHRLVVLAHLACLWQIAASFWTLTEPSRLVISRS